VLAVTTPRRNAERAIATFRAMQRYFYADDGSALYRETYPRVGGNKYAYLWPFSQALVGTLDISGIPPSLVDGTEFRGEVRDRLAGLAKYWDCAAIPPAYASYVLPPLGEGGDKYYDDNAWVGLALVQHFRMTGAASSLDRASQLFAFAVSGWDGGMSGTCPGGVFWVKQGRGLGLTNHDLGTISNAPNAELGWHLHELTGHPSYDGDGTTTPSAEVGALNMYAWVNQHLDSRGAATGPYWDKIRGDGTIDCTLWSYNQGAMIGANVLRYRLTNRAAYLERAEAIADKAMAHFGSVGYTTQPAAFNAIFFRNLLMLFAVNGNGAYMRAMESYADRAWTHARDPETNVFYFSREPARLLDQGAMVQIYALLAWNADDYTRLA
jgi:hypothetical protein